MARVTTQRVCPKHLTNDTAKLWRHLQKHYEIVEPAKLLLLTAAMECFDEMKTAKRLLRLHGPIITGRFGSMSVNPAVSAERSARHGMISTMEAMGIDLKAVEKPPVAVRRAKVAEETGKVTSLALVRDIIRGNGT